MIREGYKAHQHGKMVLGLSGDLTTSKNANAWGIKYVVYVPVCAI